MTVARTRRKEYSGDFGTSRFRVVVVVVVVVVVSEVVF